jgi:hypothetical protein
MIFAAKLALLAVVAFGVALAENAVSVFDPGISQDAALDQFDDTAGADRDVRAYAAARNSVADLLWLAVPAAAFLLFAGDVTRHVAARK